MRVAGARPPVGANRAVPRSRARTRAAWSVGARLAGASIVLAAAAVHLWLYFDFFHRVHVVGALFLLNAGAGVVSGILLLVSSHRAAAAAGVLYAAGTLAAFLVSVYHELFGYVERLTGPWQETAAGLEIAAIVVLLPLAICARRVR